MASRDSRRAQRLERRSFATTASHPLTNPPTIFGSGVNYASHGDEDPDYVFPDEVVWDFIKLSSAVSDQAKRSSFRLPMMSSNACLLLRPVERVRLRGRLRGRVRWRDWEDAKNVSPEGALDYSGAIRLSTMLALARCSSTTTRTTSARISTPLPDGPVHRHKGRSARLARDQNRVIRKRRTAPGRSSESSSVHRLWRSSGYRRSSASSRGTSCPRDASRLRSFMTTAVPPAR